MNLVKYCPEEWLDFSEMVHSLVFNESRSKDIARFDFVLAVWDQMIPVGYVHCREMDRDSIYIGYGGAFPDVRGSGKSLEGFSMILDFLKKDYKRASMLIENNNIKMLKLALNAGFKVIGLRNAEGDIFLEHSIKWGE